MLIADMARRPASRSRLSDLIVMDVPPVKGPCTVMYGTTTNTGSTCIAMQSIAFDGDHIYGPALVLIPRSSPTCLQRPLSIRLGGYGQDGVGYCIAGVRPHLCP